MSDRRRTPVLQTVRTRFREIVERERLLQAPVTVLAKPLTPEEAIGTPGRRDFPIIIGKERILEAEVRNARGQAFTDSAREFVGTLNDVLDLEPTTNQNRAIYVATLNAVLAHLGMVTATVHCKDEAPEACARDIARDLHDKYGRVRIGLIGINPAIAERLVERFGADRVRMTDLDADNIGRTRFGVEVWDGATRTEDLIEYADVVVFTGTTLVNGTFDGIWEAIHARGREYVVYGVTAAGAAALAGFERICPRGRQGRADPVPGKLAAN
jgi:uncharacterized protein (DUF4213/DUF364 family)